MNYIIRNDWSVDEVHDIYNTPLLEVVFRAANIHRKYNDTAEVQVCTLLSIKQAAVVKTALIAHRQRDITQE